jgi:hypothetical protein
VARVHWDPAPKLRAAAASNQSPVSLAPRRRHSSERARLTERDDA